MSDKPLEFKQGETLKISGLPGGAEAWWLLEHAEELGRCLVLTPSDEAAEVLYDDFRALESWRRAAPPSAEEKFGLKAVDDRPSSAVYFSEEETDARVAALTRWRAAGGDAPATFLIASRTLVAEPLPAPEEFAKDHRLLRLGDRGDRAAFLTHLTRLGYTRTDNVETVGEMAVRGEVLDLWSPGWDGPARFLWPFDQIESLRKIDLTTQRSSDALDSVLVRPASLKRDGEMERTRDGANESLPPSLSPALPHSLLDYLGKDGALYESVPADGEDAVEWTGKRVVHSELDKPDLETGYRAPSPLGSPPRLELLVKEVKSWVDGGGRVAVFCHNPGEQERLEEILLEQDRGLVPALEDRRVDFPLGSLSRGFLDPAGKRAFLSNAEIFGRYRRRLRLPKFAGGKALSGITELSAGDYVVHERFGIGRYRKLERVEAGGVEADYLRLEYRGGDRVFVPLVEFKQVQKFVGTDGKKPKISSLDTASWERTKALVSEEVAKLAAELLDRAAKRAALAGTAFPPDAHMEKEFGDSFLYDLTPDQRKAIDEVKADMVRPRPMDRLVCGDVGYGKTEVALRAAFKAVCAGRQVAVLVPTTILAEQHGRNFRERFADYPVAVAVVSRFAKPADTRRALADVRRGVVDIVIGTHRLLSPDVAFKDLGLVIIDEEHRFGVKQKERITAYRDVVDVLALSATPIPRTLGASLGGIKALSVIETPPEGRLPIATHVGPLDEKVLLAGIEQELRRGGQVFYVHNRVGTIQERKRWLEKVLSEHGLTPRIAVAHGQMTGAQLEKTMWDFLHRKFDLLLATTIIESGLDIPTVNTLVVEEAEDFGLSQLYQIRGRVGRERLKAYCYLFYSPDAGLTEDARKRLTALREFASLGSGFRLALRDLEIRGAGNLLGPQQHGFLNAVGVDLYGQLLAQEIKRQRGDGGPELKPEPEVSIELPVSAFLPEDYLPSEPERVAFYRRLLDAGPDGLADLRSELEDRCGTLPPPAERLFEVAALRFEARERKVSRIGVARKGLEIRFQPEATFAPERLDGLMRRHGDRFSFLPGPPFGMRFEPPLPDNPVVWTADFLRTLHP
jgi:transcription-repair coupling factor (superfamily II helicase)